MSAVDGAVLQKLMMDLGGEPEVMAELVATFLQEAPRMLAIMRGGLETGNLRELHRAAHSMRSTAATFGAAALSRMCRELEDGSALKMPQDAEARVAAIETEWLRVEAEVKAWKPA